MNNYLKGLIGLLYVSTCVFSVSADIFIPDDRIVSDPTKHLVDPEFDPHGNRMVWQDPSNNVYVCDIDPDTGHIIPPDGRGVHVDINALPIGETHNGPEWVFGEGTAKITYSRLWDGHRLLATGTRNGDGSWTPKLEHFSVNRWGPIGSAPEDINGPLRIAYLYYNNLSNNDLLGWRNLGDPASEQINTNASHRGGNWVAGTDFYLSTLQIDGTRQVFLTNTLSNTSTQLTSDAETKLFPIMWSAPETGERMLMVMVGTDKIGIYREVNSVWNRINTITSPAPGKPYFHSPEVFAYNGRSYIVTVLAEQLGTSGSFPNHPIGPSQIWLLGIDPDGTLARRLDDPMTSYPRVDPEFFPTTNDMVVYYTEKNSDLGIHLLRRAATGLGPDNQYDVDVNGGAWSVMHRDGKNCACTPYDVADAYTPGTNIPIANVHFSRPTYGPLDRLHFSFYDLANAAEATVGSFDTTTGAVVYKLTSEDIPSGTVMVAGSLLDGSGNSYLSGKNEFVKLDTSGNTAWTLPTTGFATSAQFLPDGNLIFFSWNGTAYVADRDNGAALLEINMTPWRTFPASPNCKLSEPQVSNCAYTQVPAVDATNSVVFNTFNRTDGSSQVHAYSYQTDPYKLSYLWLSVPITGGVSSPVLSADRTRLYVQDSSGQLLAMNTVDGTIIWQFDLGFAALEPPVVNSNGFIIPGGTLSDDPSNDTVGIIQDMGGHAEWAFQDNRYKPASAAAAGNNNRFVLAGRDANDDANLLVIHPVDGIVSVAPWGAGGTPATLKGLVLRDDGTVYVTGWGATGYQEFTPVSGP